MLRKNHVKHIRSVMKRKSDMFYKSLFFLFLKPLKTLKFFVYLVMVFSNIMNQIIIKIVNTCFLKLCIKNLIPVFFTFYKSCMQLCCNSILIPRISVNKHFFYGILTFKSTVHPRSIKVSKTSFNKFINHLFGQFNVYALIVILI